MRTLPANTADVALLDATREEFLGDADTAQALENHFDGFISDRELIDRLAALRMFAKGRAQDRLDEAQANAREIAAEDACETLGDYERDGGNVA